MHHHLHNTKPQKKDRTLVILFGEFRGNDISWQNMVDNLIKPYNADLALCIGRKDESLPQFNPLTKSLSTIGVLKNQKNGMIMLKNSLMKHQRQKLGGGKKTLDMV